MPKSHRDLKVWQAAVGLAKEVYALTGVFPREELFGLTAQLRRSSVSIASDIAEGAARQSTKEFAQFPYVATGSASELHTQLEITKDVLPVERKDLQCLQDQAEAVSSMLRGLIKSLKTRART